MKSGSSFLTLWLCFSAPWVLACSAGAYLLGDLAPPSVALTLVVLGPPAFLAALFAAVVWIMSAARD